MRQSGQQAEARAAAHLGRNGLKLIAQNYRCRAGEIDLILKEGSTLVFVEVRMRANQAFGGAAESITAAKRARVLRAARHYLAQGREAPNCRFDVVLLEGEQEIRWIKNAFGE